MRRLFLACTPRTGNVWYRKILAASLGIGETAAHSPAEINWQRLPLNCIVAMHWRWTAEFEDYLRAQGFASIVIVRDPLDVLISILRFSQREPATAKWLDGEGGDERLLSNAVPTSEEFLKYAISDRASALLAVSAEWSRHAASVVRYEELVANPELTLETAIDELGETSRSPLDEVISCHTIQRLRHLSEHHFWRGEPGLGHQLLTKSFRDRIVERHRGVFNELGYGPDYPLPPSEHAARDAWLRLCEAGAELPHKRPLTAPSNAKQPVLSDAFNR